MNRSNKSTNSDSQITTVVSNLQNNQDRESHNDHHQNPTPHNNNSSIRNKNKSTKRKREEDISQQHDLRTYEGLTFKLSNTTGVHAVESKTLQYSSSTLTSSKDGAMEGRDEPLRHVEKVETQTICSNKPLHSQKNLKFQFFGVKKHIRNQNSEEKVRILESSYTQSPFPTSFERYEILL